MKRFLMHQITEASGLGLGDFVTANKASMGVNELKVQKKQQNEFFTLICQSASQQLESMEANAVPVQAETRKEE